MKEVGRHMAIRRGLVVKYQCESCKASIIKSFIITAKERAFIKDLENYLCEECGGSTNKPKIGAKNNAKIVNGILTKAVTEIYK